MHTDSDLLDEPTRLVKIKPRLAPIDLRPITVAKVAWKARSKVSRGEEFLFRGIQPFPAAEEFLVELGIVKGRLHRELWNEAEATDGGFTYRISKNQGQPAPARD